MYDYRVIKPEYVYKSIEKQGYFYILAKKYYGENYNGPKYIIATDDPHFRERKPELAEMIIMPVDSFLKLAEVLNESMLNDRREKYRQVHLHNDEGYYDDPSEEDTFIEPLSIIDMPVDPIADHVEAGLTREILLSALDKLQEKQKRRILAYFFDGKTQLEIADIEGVNLFAIQKSINGSLKKIKKFL